MSCFPEFLVEAIIALKTCCLFLLFAGDGGEIAASHLLLGIWSEVESPGQKIMATLGFSDEKAKELESLSSEPGVVDD